MYCMDTLQARDELQIHPLLPLGVSNNTLVTIETTVTETI